MASRVFSRGRYYVPKISGFLIFVFTQKTSLLQVLTAHTESSPGNGIQPFLRQYFAAMGTPGILAFFDTFQRLID